MLALSVTRSRDSLPSPTHDRTPIKALNAALTRSGLFEHHSRTHFQRSILVISPQRLTMKPPFPSLTAEWHDDTHGAISPRRPELSLHGKTVVVSGGGAGIGRGIAQACAEAGAYAVAILGRREALLRETKQDILSRNGNVLIWTHVVDVTDIAAVKKAAQDIAKRGKWDVLVSNAGYMPTAAPVAESAGDDWWKAFEVSILLVPSSIPP